jgi:hypothetical protein
MRGAVEATVGLPILRSRDVSWIAMESLCRQVTDFRWELIVYEDGPDRVGQATIESYAPRLRDSGCVNLVYMTVSQRIPLSHKWHAMANVAADSSVTFLMHGADDWSDMGRVARSHEFIQSGDEWVCNRSSYFYCRLTGRVVLVDFDRMTVPIRVGPHIALRTDALRRIVPVPLARGNDMHVFASVRPDRVRRVESESLCTDGACGITDRSSWFGTTPPDFVRAYAGTKSVCDFIPEDLLPRLLSYRVTG